MDRSGPYLFIWCLVMVFMLLGYGVLEAFLLDDLEDQINGNM